MAFFWGGENGVPSLVYTQVAEWNEFWNCLLFGFVSRNIEESSAIEYFGGWSGLGVAAHAPLFVIATVGGNCSSVFMKLSVLRKLCGVNSFELILSCEKYKTFDYEGNQHMNYFLYLVVVSIWWVSGTPIHAVIATSQRLGMFAHQKRRTDLGNLAGTSRWSPDHKRCFDGSS